MTVDNMTDNVQRVFIWTGSVAHLLDIDQPLRPDEHVSRAPALCKARPFWPGQWLSDESPEISARGLFLPLCKICEAIRGSSERVEPT